LVETEGVGENPEKMNPFQSNPTRFASKLIPSQPICPVNPLTSIQIIPQNNPTPKLQILSDPLAGLFTAHQHPTPVPSPSRSEAEQLALAGGKAQEGGVRMLSCHGCRASSRSRARTGACPSTTGPAPGKPHGRDREVHDLPIWRDDRGRSRALEWKRGHAAPVHGDHGGAVSRCHLLTTRPRRSGAVEELRSQMLS